ncbi:FAD dependent oxidoreductase [Dillenia turbinata]|uniref:FAD-dependent oxidoreductase domain-containing protein 1 n=1 Tax=Dillenia turbinata TaxID=194707 RepID=A0AAN8VUR4_9MAGN
MGAFSIHTARPATPHSTRSRTLPTTSAKRHLLLPSVFSFKSSFYAPDFLEKSLYLQSSITQRRSNSGSPIISASHSQHRSFDVVIIGAGIIGLAIARQILLHSNLSVALVDAAVPCSGATGAGQGYIWMAHKTPGSDIWELAMRSHKLWEMLAESIRQDGMSPSQVLGWKKTGSLLIGRNFEDSDMLKMRVKQLSAAGVRSEYLSGSNLLIKEPALMDNIEGGAAYFPDDCQLDAQRTVAFIEKRFCIKRSASTGMVEAVQTSKSILYSTRAIVVAAGCWSGSLMHELIQNLDIVLDVPVMPRKVGNDAQIYELRNKTVCPEDATKFQKLVERERIYDFLAGLNMEYDQIRVQVLGTLKTGVGSFMVDQIRAEEESIQGHQDHRQTCMKLLKHQRLARSPMEAFPMKSDSDENDKQPHVGRLGRVDLRTYTCRDKADKAIEHVLPSQTPPLNSGHLLVIENFEALKLNHGLMEVGYIDHKVVSSDSGLNRGEQTLSISMTATFDTMGNLLLGSSRQFAGFNTEVNESIVDRIWNRAGEFFPVLRKLSLRDFINSRKVRIGLRPYMPDGKPVIGPIPGLSNVILATGHEGGGLAMALGTAEMVADMVLGNPGIVDPQPFSVQGRCC